MLTLFQKPAQIEPTPQPTSEPMALRYGAALAVSILAAVVVTQLPPAVARLTLLLLFPLAIVTSTAMGGLVPGLLSVGLSGVAMSFRHGRFHPLEWPDLFPLGCFVLLAAVVTWQRRRVEEELARSQNLESDLTDL